MTADDTAVLHLPTGDQEMPIKPATEGASAFDIGKLLSGTGLVTLDSGFVNTAACSSAITYIDGDAGILRYRGYPIEQLAEKSTFLEVSYLLIYGELPTADAAGRVHQPDPAAHAAARGPEAVLRRLPARRAPDAGAVRGGLRAVDASTRTRSTRSTSRDVELSTIRLLAKLPTIAAYAYKKSIGQPFLYPDNSLALVENFLRMTFGFPAEPYEVDPEVVKALDLLLILHADHEQNCSTSTVRLVGSSQANLFASISAGINALFGPAARRRQPGGARDARGDPRRAAATSTTFVDAGEEQGSRRQADGLRPPRLQELRPARARSSRRRADEILEQARRRATRCSTSPRSSRRSRSTDDYFIERKLYPNVDFYTGLIYRAMGFPTQDVHGAVRARPAARLDRALARDDRRPGDQDRPPAPDLHRLTPSGPMCP